MFERGALLILVLVSLLAVSLFGDDKKDRLQADNEMLRVQILQLQTTLAQAQTNNGILVRMLTHQSDQVAAELKKMRLKPGTQSLAEPLERVGEAVDRNTEAQNAKAEETRQLLKRVEDTVLRSFREADAEARKRQKSFLNMNNLEFGVLMLLLFTGFILTMAALHSLAAALRSLLSALTVPGGRCG